MPEISVEYKMTSDNFPRLDGELDAIAGKSSGSSGAGLGYRDRQYQIPQQDRASEIAGRMAALPGVETVTLDGVQMHPPANNGGDATTTLG